METSVLQRLNMFIKEKGMTNRKIANLLGMNEMTLSNKLNGIRSLDLNTIELFANHFEDLSMEWLIRGVPSSNNQNIINVSNSKITGVNVHGNGIAINDADFQILKDIVTRYQYQTEKFQNQIDRLITLLENGKQSKN